MSDQPDHSKNSKALQQKQKLILLNSIVDLFLFIIIFQILRSYLSESVPNSWFSSGKVGLVTLLGIVLIKFRVSYDKIENQKHNMALKIVMGIVVLVVALIVL